MREFGYFIEKINNNHPKTGIRESNPIKESNLNKFKRSMGHFSSEFYFGDLNEAMKALDVAKKFAHKIDPENMDIVESYTFNRSVIEWLKGNYTLNDITRKNMSGHTIQFIGYSNSLPNLYKEVKVIRT